jgi:hypothetical protein
MRLEKTEAISVAGDAVLSKGWSTTIPAVKSAALQIENVGDAASGYTLTTSGPKSPSPVCTDIGTLRGTDVVRYDLLVLSSGLKIAIALPPGSSVKVSVYTSGFPATAADRPADPKHVGLPLQVYVVPSAPLENAVNAHMKAAVAIWAEAGVHLQPKITRLSKAQAETLLGSDLTIRGYLGCIQRFSAGYERREALAHQKPKPDALAVFFVKSSGQSQAEPEFVQAYIAEDVMGAPLGRTVAHEIGHLLLGYGHTGGEQRTTPCDRAASEQTIEPKRPAPWTSGLMRDGSSSNGVDISERDASTARLRALQLPSAVWWP